MKSPSSSIRKNMLSTFRFIHHRTDCRQMMFIFCILILQATCFTFTSILNSPSTNSIAFNPLRRTVSTKRLASSRINGENNIETITATPPTTTTTTNNPVNGPARAGRDGYSLTRQPLHRDTWDATIDPSFQVPKSRDSDDDENNSNNKNNLYRRQDLEWWSSRQKNDDSRKNNQNKGKEYEKLSSSSTTTTSSSSSKNENKIISIDDAESLDLFQRSFDTLDFPSILRSLRQECYTIPAKHIIDQALVSTISTTRKSSNADNDDNNSNNNNNSSSITSKPKNRKVQPNTRLIADDPQTVQNQYQAVQEMQWLLDTSNNILDKGAYYKNRKGYQVSIGNGSPPPIEGLTFDLNSILQLVEQGQILQGPEVLDISIMMNAMEDIQYWSNALGSISVRNVCGPNSLQQEYDGTDDVHKQPESQSFVQLPAIVQGMQLNTTLQTLLDDAFDKDGKLSGTTFPILGQLRVKVRTLKADILQTLDALVQLPSIKSKLALESGGPLISEVSSAGGGGRLVLPIYPKHASELGIVHDSSRSGKTVYVEPSEIVVPTNELRQIEYELEQEEAIIWKSLTEQIWNNRHDLQNSVQAVAQLDLCQARCALGQRLDGVIPEVKNEGVISLQDAKHPVLLLRKVENVVGSEILLGANGNQGLVLTGPNSGGKTVILKLLGLVALMSRSGIPIPAAPPAYSTESNYYPRVDFFNPVLADIGDIQSVDGDLSTFSGHMLVCREVLALAKSGKNALVLMDELGSGTDPAQGVAIAQAVLEALLETGCRVAITTHYMALKQLASSDDRFSVAGMQFVGGRPTYKLLPGVVGESYALAVAERLQLPQKVVERANQLLDSETRQLGDLIQDLEAQKLLIEEQVEEIEEKKRAIDAMEIKMKQERIKLEKKMLTARRDEAQKFAKQLEEKEKILEDVLEKLKSDPSRKLIAKSWEDIKFVKRDAINEAENVPSVLKAKKKAAEAVEEAKQDLVPLAEIRNRPTLNDGDMVTVCKPGALFGRQARVVKDLGKQIQVQVSGMDMSLKHTDLSMVPPTSTSVQAKVVPNVSDGKSPKISKSVERALMAENNGLSTASGEQEPKSKASSLGIRLDSNTVDVRGCNFEDAKDNVTAKISKCVINGQNVVYVLHGHGPGGVLKSKLRGWMRSEKNLIKQWRPADRSDGGDAFTRLELK